MQQSREKKNIQPPSRENNWNQNQSKIKQQLRKVEMEMKMRNDNDEDNEQYEDEYNEEYEEEVESFREEELDGNKKKENINNNVDKLLEKRLPTTLSVGPQLQQHYSNQEEQKQHEQFQQSLPPLCTRQQLLTMSQQNKQQIIAIKQLISDHREQLKKIGQLVDDDLQKSMIDLNVIVQQQKNVNIKELFSEKVDKNQPQKIKKLREQLSALRKENKLIKQQIIKQSDLLNDPVNKQNFYKQQLLLSQLKMINTQVTNRRKQAIIMKDELKRIKQSANLQQAELTQKLISQNELLLNQIISEVKQEKAKAYRLQKEDIFLMEKIKFLKERNDQGCESVASREQRVNLDKEMRVEMGNLMRDINDILEERNKVQVEKSKLLRSLDTQIDSYQQKNLQLVTQLRSIDAYLLQHYSQKKHQQLHQQRLQSLSRVTKTAEKKDESKPKQLERKPHYSNSSKLNKSKVAVDDMRGGANTSGFESVGEDDNIGRGGECLENGSSSLLMSESRELTVGSNIKSNDKNINPNIPVNSKFRTKQTSNNSHNNNKPSKSQSMVNTEEQHQQPYIQQQTKPLQKEKYFIEIKNNLASKQKLTYTFGDMKIDDRGAILSDEILGLVKIKEITFLVDDENCYGVYCKYVKTDDGKEVNGIKIHEKNAEEMTTKASLQVKDDQWVEVIRIGCSPIKNQIKCIEVVKNNNNSQQSLIWRAKSEQQGVKMEQVKLQKYSLSFIKGKLVSSEEMHSMSKSLNELSKAKPKLKLGGFGVNCVVKYKR